MDVGRLTAELGKLNGALEEREDVLLLRTPVAFHRKRGITFLLAIPFLALVCGGLCTGGIADEGGLSGEELGILLVVVGVPVLLVAAAGVFWGVVTLLRAQAKSDASLVRVDLGRRVIEHAGGTAPLSEFTSLELVQPSKVFKWRAIRACRPVGSKDSANPYASSAKGQPLVLLENIEPVQGEQAGVLMRHLGERMGLPVRADEGMDKSAVGGLGGKSHTSAMLCYLPVQGIWLIASIGLVIFSKEPLVRFHAKQSLTMGALHVGLLIAMISGAALGYEVVGSEPLGGAFLLLGLLPVMGLTILRFVGCFQAYKGRWWVCPGLGWLTRRWIPADQGENA